MTSLDYYLNEDHAARRRTTLLAVAVGAATLIICRLLGFTTNLSVVLTALATGTVEVGRAASYKPLSTRARRTRPASITTRRYVLRAIGSAAGLLLASMLRVPRIEAAILERRILKATSGSSSYDKAARLISYAYENDIPISKSVVDTAKRRLTQAYSVAPQNSSIGTSLSQLIAYEVYRRTGLKLTLPANGVIAGPSPLKLWAGISVPPWGAVFVGEGIASTTLEVLFDYSPDMKPAVMSLAQQQNDSAFTNFSVVRKGDLITAPAFVLLDEGARTVVVLDVAVLNLSQTLDDVVWDNVTFDHCRVGYRGGRVHLGSVRFKNCEFIAENDKGRDLLNQLQTFGEQPVTLFRP